MAGQKPRGPEEREGGDGGCQAGEEATYAMLDKGPGEEDGGEGDALELGGERDGHQEPGGEDGTAFESEHGGNHEEGIDRIELAPD